MAIKVIEQEDPYASDSSYLRFHLLSQVFDQVKPLNPDELGTYLDVAVKFVLAGGASKDGAGDQPEQPHKNGGFYL